jgi:UDP-N-acetylmuramoyl-L-alanyl-D-glutamate--2,6-diaminopimelate ligase
MRLSDLLSKANLEGAYPVGGASEVEIEHICEDSRRAERGTLFVAIKGSANDGHRFITQALDAGAVAVAGEREERPEGLPDTVPYIHVDDDRQAVSHFSAAFFDYPSRKLQVIGVTGTDGKTTTSTLIYHILMAAGRNAGLISTIRAEIGGRSYETGFHVTTPEAFDVQRYLAEMVDAGTDVAVLETTSHALDQGRTLCVNYDVAVVTNVTHEHLDWHGSWENYLTAKAKLFQALNGAFRKPGTPKVTVINADDRSYDHLKRIPADMQFVYGLDRKQQPDITVEEIEYTATGTRFVAQTPAADFPVRLKLPGKHNVYNALAAIGAALALGIPKEAIGSGLESVELIRGRMEYVEEARPFGFDVVVDFAHTPNGLEKTLELAGQIARPRGGRVIAVFGAAGLRDRKKRPLMGAIAGRLADLTIITAEDPRTERVEDISAQIAEALKAEGRVEGRDFWQVFDRAEAIAFAISQARPGDLVISCGKSHEGSMCYGTDELPWDEFEAVRAGLEMLTTRRRRQVTEDR